MTEQEWLTCTHPQKMLEFLGGKASNRKLRLLACTLCRRIPGFLESQPDREGLELTERDVEGLAKEEDFGALPEDNWDIRWYRRDGWDALDRAMESYWCFLLDSQNLHVTPGQAQTEARRQSYAELAVLVLDVFGNPFRSIDLEPAWLTWNNGMIPKLAQAIYDDRAFDRLPILADALEEAGCDNPDLLSHCRGPGPHTRGCWPVDLLLGKE